MEFEDKVSLIVGLRNNLDYTQAFYERVRQLYKSVEIVFVSYGSTDGTHQWLDNLSDNHVKFYYSDESKSLSHTYNKGVELATSKLVTYLHNDMIIGEGFVEALVQAWKPKSVVFYSLIEPPIFTDDSFDWKTVKDFGDSIENFDLKGFDEFVKNKKEDAKQIFKTNDHSFFLCVEREWLLKMGGLDETFTPMFCEDLDLLMRFSIQEANLIQVPNALAYHFVSKTSRFSKEYKSETKNIDELGIRNFYRKWRFHPFAEYRKSFDMVAVVKHATTDSLFQIEPFFAMTYVDQNKKEYIEKYQKDTKIDLNGRISPMSEIKPHDVVIYLDVDKLTDKDYQRIRNLSDIISRNEIKHGKPLKRLFKNYKKINTGNIKGEINNFRSFENEFPVAVHND